MTWKNNQAYFSPPRVRPALKEEILALMGNRLVIQKCIRWHSLAKPQETLIRNIITGYILRNELKKCNEFVIAAGKNDSHQLAREIQIQCYTEHGFFKEIAESMAEANADNSIQATKNDTPATSGDLLALHLLHLNAKEQFIFLNRALMSAHLNEDNFKVKTILALIDQLFSIENNIITLDELWFDDLAVIKSLAIYYVISRRLKNEEDYHQILGLLRYPNQQNILLTELATLNAYLYDLNQVSLLQRVAASYMRNGAQLILEFTTFGYMQSQRYNKKEINTLLEFAPALQIATTIRQTLAFHYLLKLQIHHALDVLGYSESMRDQKRAVWLAIQHYLKNDNIQAIATITSLLPYSDSKNIIFRGIMHAIKPKLHDAKSTLHLFWDVDPLFIKQFFEIVKGDAHLPVDVINLFRLLPYMLSFYGPLSLSQKTVLTMLNATQAQWLLFVEEHHLRLTHDMSSDINSILKLVKQDPKEFTEKSVNKISFARRFLFRFHNNLDIGQDHMKKDSCSLVHESPEI